MDGQWNQGANSSSGSSSLLLFSSLPYKGGEGGGGSSWAQQDKHQEHHHATKVLNLYKNTLQHPCSFKEKYRLVGEATWKLIWPTVSNGSAMRVCACACCVCSLCMWKSCWGESLACKSLQCYTLTHMHTNAKTHTHTDSIFLHNPVCMALDLTLQTLLKPDPHSPVALPHW